MDDDLSRFYRSHYAIHDAYGRRVFTVVVYGAGITAAPDELDLGSVVYRVQNIYLGSRDAEEVLGRLQARAAAGERWTAQEQLEAILLPLMRRERPLEELVVDLARAGEALPTAERATVLGSMAGLAYNYLEPGMAEALLEALRMTNAFIQLLEDTVSQALAAGKREDLVKVLSQRFRPLDPTIAARIATINDPDRLAALFDAALDAATLEDFQRALDGESDA